MGKEKAMLTIPVIQEELEVAKADAEKLGKLNRSILNGDGNYAGFIGELAVLRVLNYLGAKRSNTYEHDLLIGRWRFDVKTKRRTVRPLEHFVGTVPAYSNQKCHAYIFTSVELGHDEVPLSVTLCGWIRKDDFAREAVHVSKDEVDPSNGFKCHMDCMNIPYGKLQPIFDLECQLMLAFEKAGRAGR